MIVFRSVSPSLPFGSSSEHLFIITIFHPQPTQRVQAVYQYRTTHSLAGSCSFTYSLHPAQSIHPDHCSSAHHQSFQFQPYSSGHHTPPFPPHHPLSPDRVPIHRTTQLTLKIQHSIPRHRSITTTNSTNLVPISQPQCQDQTETTNTNQKTRR